MKLTRKLRYAIVDVANHSQRVCWADCVAWAEGVSGEPFLALFDSVQRNYCNDPAGPCYCGKFRPAGMPEYTDDDAPF